MSKRSGWSRYSRVVVCGMLLAALQAPAWSSEAAAGKAESFTLAESIAAHASLQFRTNTLVVPPSGRYAAWIEGSKLMIASAPEFQPREVLVSQGGGSLSAAYAAPDDVTIYYTRGTTTPAFGPHPASDTREFWRVDTTNGRTERLAAGGDVPESAPVFSPDGKSFATADGPMVFEYRVDGTSLSRRPILENNAEHYAAEKLTSLTYSPDGKRLAFVSWRKAAHSYVAILDVATGKAQYLQPGIFRDQSPVWSPDGRELAFVRMPGNWTREYRFSPSKQGAPWSLMVAAASGGAVRTLWQADTGIGSVFEPYGIGSWLEPNSEVTQLLWTASGQIVFPWEKTGWASAYAIDAKGGTPKPLMTGKGEVTLPTLAGDGRSILFASNVEDSARLHVWRAPLSGGKPERLTSGGVEHSPIALAGGVAYISNDKGRLPNRHMLATTRGAARPLGAYSNVSTRTAKVWEQFVDTDVVPVKAADGVVSQQLIFWPRSPAPKSGYPVIVSSKGGPSGRVSPGNGVYTALGQYAASRGYVFVEMNYRGGTGDGLEYRLPDGRGATGGSEVKDIEALVLYLRGRREVDAKRIGIMGGSYGGFIVSLALTRLPQYFAAGAHLSGVGDWVGEMKLDQRDEGWASAPPEYIRLSERIQIEDLAFNSSSVSNIAAWRAPTLITMGEMDRSGHMEGIIDLGYRLLEQGTHVEVSIAPEAGHTGPRARPMDKVFDFFERYL
ncbi:S9 family peptidase [Steroidobacter sp.]|uniref:S9 family peptidase n=1 Tax=Steroidobacter sp. TaxID=1978227 RepID=UPI001A36B3EF|nr:prolyl oligopeptidase family serine peptidase [Steroidobacter sp.]MBL8270867.1 S9 family peptidase [Steroidobacter sp.]